MAASARGKSLQLRQSRSIHFLVACAALGGSVSVLFAFRQFPSSRSAMWSLLFQTDFGNALAALVAVAGYLLDHWNTQKAQQLEAQIQRVSSQSHQLLVPITMQLQALFSCATLQFVDKHMASTVHFIEREYGDANHASEVLREYLTSPVMNLATKLKNPSAIAILARELMVTQRTCHDSAKPIEARSRFAAITTVPRELPIFLHRAIEESERPASKLWKSYEAFIRNEFIPAVARIAEIIDEHGHLMEPVSPQRLAEIFDSPGTGYGQKWEMAPRMWFYSMWLAYARSWKSVLAMWDAGEYEEIRPDTNFPIGLLLFNVEAQTIVAEVEKDLVGMSQMHGHRSASNLR